MRSYKSEGISIEYTNPSSSVTLAAGAIVVLAGMIGIVAADIAPLVSGTVQVRGVFSLAKATGVIAQGDKLYWDDSAKKLTKTAASNTPAGAAAIAALSGDASVDVLLIPGMQSQAAKVTPLGTTTDLVGVNGTGSNAAPLAGTEARLDALEAKVDATLAALTAATLMSAT